MSLISCAQIVGNPVMAPAPAALPSSAPPALSTARRDGPAAFSRAPAELFFAAGDWFENSLSLAMTSLLARNTVFARFSAVRGPRWKLLVSHVRSRASQRKKIGNTNSLDKTD